MEFTIIILVSILFGLVLCFFMVKKYRKLKALSEVDRKNEIDKSNKKGSLAIFFKDILELFT
jgi:hypothetical protein